MPNPVAYRNPPKKLRRGRPPPPRPDEAYDAEELAALDALIARRFGAIANRLRRRGLYNALMRRIDLEHEDVAEGADWTAASPDWAAFDAEAGDPEASYGAARDSDPPVAAPPIAGWQAAWMERHADDPVSWDFIAEHDAWIARLAETQTRPGAEERMGRAGAML